MIHDPAMVTRRVLLSCFWAVGFEVSFFLGELRGIHGPVYHGVAMSAGLAEVSYAQEVSEAEQRLQSHHQATWQIADEKCCHVKTHEAPLYIYIYMYMYTHICDINKCIYT